MRITKKYVKAGFAIYSELEYNRFCVRVAPRLTPDNREQRVRFPYSAHDDSGIKAYEAACRWIEDQLENKKDGGRQAFALTPAQQTRTATAFAKLREAGCDITEDELVSYYLSRERPTGGEIILSKAIDAFVSEKRSIGRAATYIKRLLGCVAQFARFHEKQYLQDHPEQMTIFQKASAEAKKKGESLTPGWGVLCQTLDEAKCKKWLFVTKANLTQNGRHHYHSDLSNFFEWLRLQNHVGVNPWVRVPKPEKLPTETGILSIWQAGLLLEAARDEDLIAPIVLGLFCGVRPAEITRLSWADIELSEITSET